MAKREQEKDKLAEVFDNQPKVKASQEAREKSLQAFQDGLKENRSTHKKEKRLKFRKHLIGLSLTVAAAGLVTVLTFGAFGEPSPEDAGSQGSDGPQKQESEQTNIEPQEISDILNEILKRRPLCLEETEHFQHVDLFEEGPLYSYMPGDWEWMVSEDKNTHTLHLTGPAGEEMYLMLFKQEASDLFNKRVQGVAANYAHAEKIPIQTEHFVEELKTNRMIHPKFDDILPFDITNTEMAAFIDKENGTFHDFIVSELFGYPMIFTSKLSLDDVDSWNLPIHFFTEIHVTEEPMVVRGSEGEDHPEYKRPIDKTVLVSIGASWRPEIIEMELYENEELQLTSYLPADTEVERNEHEYFTEWRFTNPSISKNSFYSIGKLNDGFPFENGEEIMFDTFGIDPAFSPGPLGNTHYYPYESIYAGKDSDSNIGGYFELFEANGAWYYMHTHNDYEEYNGGHLLTRLEYFISSIEWH